MTIVRSCYIASTKDDQNKGGRRSTFFNEPINEEWNTMYRQDFNDALLNKEGLTNIITFDVKSYVSDIKNYLTYGVRHHIIRLIKNLFPNDKADYKTIAALRFLKNMQAENKSKVFSFKLSSKDISIAEQERNDKTNETIERILQDDMLKD